MITTPILILAIAQCIMFLIITWAAYKQVKTFEELDDLQDQINFLHSKIKAFEETYKQ